MESGIKSRFAAQQNWTGLLNFYTFAWMDKVVIAIDIMGGDKDPVASVTAVLHACAKHHNVHFLLFGDKNKIPDNLRSQMEANRNTIELVQCDCVVDPEEKPATVIRRSRETTMGKAIIAVKEGRAHAAISSGSTGVLMAVGKIFLGTIAGIERPAICNLWPSEKKPFAVLDLGANISMTPKQALQFAIMGNAFYSCYTGIPSPRFGLLNIGTESHKGTDAVREARDLIQNEDAGGRFIGFIESDAAFEGKCDVVVTDGFSGNIALKTLEGGLRLILKLMSESFNSNLFTRIGYLLVRKRLKKKMKAVDPNKYNGAMLVGLNGVCVKSHGGADANAFLSAINTTILLVRNKVNDSIKARIAKTNAKGSSDAGADASAVDSSPTENDKIAIALGFESGPEADKE